MVTKATNKARGCTSRSRAFVIVPSAKGDVVLVHALRCKQWKCRSCAELNKDRWMDRIERHVKATMEQGTVWFFVTVTSSAKARGFTKSIWVWRHAWPKLYARMKRKAGKFEYCLLPERHRDGTLHVHMLTTADMKVRWYKDNAPSCGLGYQNDVTRVTTAGQAARYVTKYIGKTLHDANWPSKFRRVRVSRGWPKRSGKGLPDGSQVARGNVELIELCAAIRDAGKTPIWAETGELVIQGGNGQIRRF